MSEGDSFLPRIQSVFYAVFDARQGSKIVYQVPENFIAVPVPPPAPPHPSPSADVPPLLSSRTSSASLVSPAPPRHLPSPNKRSPSAHPTSFNFSDISMYVIPPLPLCGRLVTFSTRRHRIIGFPVALKGSYVRNYFRYNLCFVFLREADLSCYEPIVRKISMVLKSCEEESSFLSSPDKSSAVHAILEQLYEDLNSYSETSIPIDQFNSIELKIFPFYPNPPQVKDWIVPLALINLPKRIESNWDLTMLKVCKYIDGVNHVSRIAHLADCDISLTRQAISHLLYYQVIMTIDIFQYSNSYTLRRSIQWFADEPHVKEECGPYVTRPGKSIPDWPKLLHLYSRLKPGKTVYDWMKIYDVENLGIDVRRFTSFGVVKGFLRRVHRYPVYMPPDPSDPISAQLEYALQPQIDPTSNSILARKRGKSLSNTSIRFPAFNIPNQADHSATPFTVTFPPPPLDTAASTNLATVETPLSSATSASVVAHRARRASAAEKVLEQLRSRDMQKTALASPRTSWINFQHENVSVPPSLRTTATETITPPSNTVNSGLSVSMAPPPTQDSPTKATGGRSESRRQSLTAPVVPPPSPVLSKITLTPTRPNRSSRSPSVSQVNHQPSQSLSWPALPPPAIPAIPPDLIALLDGDHHTDELSVRFEAGWPLLERWLTEIGGGGEPKGDGDYGRVVIVYR